MGMRGNFEETYSGTTIKVLIWRVSGIPIRHVSAGGKWLSRILWKSDQRLELYRDRYFDQRSADRLGFFGTRRLLLGIRYENGVLSRTFTITTSTNKVRISFERFLSIVKKNQLISI